MHNGTIRGRRKKTEKNMRNENDKEFSHIKIKPQTIDTGIYKPLKMINAKKKKKIQRHLMGIINILPTDEEIQGFHLTFLQKI